MKPLAKHFCFFLSIITLLAFFQVFFCDFVYYDDDVYVFKNPFVRAGLTLESIHWALTTLHFGNWVPLTWLSLMLDAQIYGLNPMGFHFTNLLFHLANVVLLFWLFLKLTGLEWRSFFVALLFAVHPLAVEPVAWISSRKDVLCGFFMMLSLGSYACYVTKEKMRYYFLTLGCFSLGLIAKPILMTLPVLLLLLDYWPLKRFDGFLPTKKCVLEKIPFFIIFALVCIVTFFAQGKIGAIESGEVFENLKVASLGYAIYVSKFFVPVNLGVAYVFHLEQIPMAAFVLCGVFMGVVSVLILLFSKEERFWVMGWFWFLIMLVPVVGFVKVGTQFMADRHVYLASIGLSIIFVWLISGVFDHLKLSEKVRGVLGLILILSLVTAANYQLIYWQSTEALLGRALQLDRNNYLAHMALGGYYGHIGESEKAKEAYTESLRLKPDLHTAHVNLAGIYYSEQNYADAAMHYAKYLKAVPQDKTAQQYYNDALNQVTLK